MQHRIISIALGLLATSSTCGAQEVATSPPSSSIGYATVEEALQSLKAKQGVNITTTKPDAWVIVTEPTTYVQWSFTPIGHYAHPSVVRREVKQSEGKVYVQMNALCQAEKAACDKLMEEFKQLNDRMRQSIQERIDAGRQR